MEDSQYDWDEEFVNREIMRGRLWGMGILVLCAIAALFVVAWLMLKPANAQSVPCAQKADVFASLAKVDQRPIFTGTIVGPDRALTEVVIAADPVTRMWTFLTTTDGKTFCLIFPGRDLAPADLDKLIGPRS